MDISNPVCIQITSPGGTPIRGKNAGLNKCLFIFLLTAPSPSPPSLHCVLIPKALASLLALTLPVLTTDAFNVY